MCLYSKPEFLKNWLAEQDTDQPYGNMCHVYKILTRGKSQSGKIILKSPIHSQKLWKEGHHEVKKITSYPSSMNPSVNIYTEGFHVYLEKPKPEEGWCSTADCIVRFTIAHEDIVAIGWSCNHMFDDPNGVCACTPQAIVKALDLRREDYKQAVNS